jgi:hypothetical protein
MAESDKKISAGLYTFAIEEFGKIQVLKNTPPINGNHTINYRREFVRHPVKFPLAFNYLKNNNYDKCLELSEGGYDYNGFVSEAFEIQLSADFETRLLIFYSDFDSDGSIAELPPVDSNLLREAIDGLEMATAN